MKTGIVFFVAFVYAALIPAEPFNRPLFSEGESAVYKTGIIVKKSRKTGWGGQMSLRYLPVEWTQHIKTSGDYIVWTRTEKLLGGGKREMQAFIKGSVKVMVTRWTDIYYSPSGRQETKIETDFTDPSLKYPPDMAPVFVLPFLLRSANMESGKIHEVRVWFGPTTFSRATWRVHGKKTINVAAGKIECYEVEGRILIDEDGIIAEMLQKFLPSYYYYLSVAPPHHLVRFQTTMPDQETFYDELLSFSAGK